MNGRSARFLLVLLLPSPLGAQIARDSARLADIVVSASRDSASARTRAAAADLVSSGEANRRGLRRLGDILRLLPGATVVATGAPGGVASTFLRGVNSNQTLLLIDGVRVNDANTAAAALFGGLELDPTDQVEVVRGPQGTLFGGAAVGGTIAIGAGNLGRRASLRGETEIGSFATFQGRVSGSARAGRLSVTGSASLTDAENQRPFNQYDRRSQSVAARFRISERWTAGATARGLQSHHSSPGDLRTTNSTPVATTEFDHHLVTAFVAGPLAKEWSSRLTVGGQGYFLRGTSQFDGGDPFVAGLKTNRWVVDWQHRVELGRRLVAVGGLNAEWTAVADNDGRRDEKLRAGYADLSLSPTSDLSVTAGLRHDHYTTFGGRTTARLAAGYFLVEQRLKVRATYGTGFLPPSLAARYGGPFQHANPGIRPERSRGWDFGIDHFFAGDRAVVSVTAFGNELEDLIGFESAPFPELGRAVNIDRARTRGIELSSRAELGAIDLRAGYTYLRAVDLGATDPAEQRLIRRPRHSGSLDLAWSIDRFTVGVGAIAAVDREDTDFSTFPFRRVDPGNIFDARLTLEWRANGVLAVRWRLENLFDERYEEVYGFPVLGRRVTVGLSLSAGGAAAR